MEAAWIAVIGSLGGVFLGSVGNILVDHLRSDREARQFDRQRVVDLEDRRRELAVNFATLAESVRDRVWYLGAYREQNPEAGPLDQYVQTQHEKLAAAYGDFNRTYFELRVLGAGAFAKQAEAIDDAVEALINGIRSEPPEYAGAFWNELDAYLQAVGREFGTGRRVARFPQRPS